MRKMNFSKIIKCFFLPISKTWRCILWIEINFLHFLHIIIFYYKYFSLTALFFQNAQQSARTEWKKNVCTTQWWKNDLIFLNILMQLLYFFAICICHSWVGWRFDIILHKQLIYSPLHPHYNTDNTRPIIELHALMTI